MELMDLRCFVAVAEELHVGRAAARLQISAAQVSQRLKQLEVEIGGPLARRTTRSVRLTALGEEMLVGARDVLSAAEHLRRHVRSLAGGESGVLRVGVIGSVATTLLPRLVRIVETRMPGVELHVFAQMFTPDQERMLLERSIDVGLVRTPLTAPGLTFRVIHRDPLALAVPDDHALAGRDRVRVADLRSERFITYPAASGSVVARTVAREMRAAGFAPRQVIEVNETHGVIGLVAAGLGIALVPGSARDLLVSGVTFVEVHEAPAFDIALAWRSDDDSAVVRRLVDAVDGAGLFHDRTVRETS